MGEIVKHDFGKDDREHARRLKRLLNLLKEQDEDLLADPGKYFAMASERLAEQARFIHAVSDAVQLPWMVKSTYVDFEPPHQMEIDTMIVDRRDYEALQAIKKLIREWDQRS